MYSPNLKQFIDDHRPADIRWSVEEVRELAEQSGSVSFIEGPQSVEGLRVNKDEVALVVWGELSERPQRQRVDFAGLTRFVKWLLAESLYEWVESPTERERFHYSLEFAPDNGVWVRWNEDFEGEELVFKPYVDAWSGSIYGSVPDPRGVLLAQAGITPVRTRLPEPVATLPLGNPWSYTRAYDWGSGEITDTTVCFRSEVEGIVRPYIQELEAIACGEASQ